MKRIFNAFFKIITSRKGLLTIGGIVLGCYMSIPLKANFTEWALYTGGLLTALGVGIQNDKKIEQPLLGGENK